MSTELASVHAQSRLSTSRFASEPMATILLAPIKWSVGLFPLFSHAVCALMGPIRTFCHLVYSGIGIRSRADQNSRPSSSTWRMHSEGAWAGSARGAIKWLKAHRCSAAGDVGWLSARGCVSKTAAVIDLPSRCSAYWQIFLRIQMPCLQSGTMILNGSVPEGCRYAAHAVGSS